MPCATTARVRKRWFVWRCTVQRKKHETCNVQHHTTRIALGLVQRRCESFRITQRSVGWCAETWRIASHRIASRRIASHRIATQRTVYRMQHQHLTYGMACNNAIKTSCTTDSTTPATCNTQRCNGRMWHATLALSSAQVWQALGGGGRRWPTAWPTAMTDGVQRRHTRTRIRQRCSSRTCATRSACLEHSVALDWTLGTIVRPVFT